MDASAEQRFVEALGYRFDDPDLLRAALTHRSADAVNNERLEFLGDALIGTIVAIDLFQRRPRAPEGELTRLRAWLVRGETLAAVARELGLGEVLRVGAGERKSGGRGRDSLLADGLEAVVGAVFLDADFATVQALVQRLLGERLERLPAAAELKDPKTRLQEYLQAQQQPVPAYEQVNVAGADHARRFTVRCRIDGLDLAREATAGSRRRAEQQAARACLEALGERVGE